jgi:RNA-directed DNA polymerase
MSTPETVIQEWRDVPWMEVERDVHGLQRRIYQASLKDDIERIHRLQRLLMSSRSSKLLAVRRVTQDNQGKKTAGIDGIASLDPEERFLLVEQLDLDARPKPTRRVWIPKPGTDEMRPLGIPTMHDRATQALVKLALEPEWEARFEPNSYGFRPGRSCQDAIQAIFLAIRFRSKWVLDADIAKCFDRIDHEALLNKLGTFSALRQVIRAWLKAGVLDGDSLFPTKEGTPQGGVISPLLANVALHGLEIAIQSHFPRRRRKDDGKYDNSWTPQVVRYADDFVVLHHDERVVRDCQTIAQEWLKGMKLELKPSKTRVAHTLQEVEGKTGFDFLGFAVRQWPTGKYRSGKNRGGLLGFKTIIKPSKEKVKVHYAKLKEVVVCMNCKSQADLIKALNPIIKGWCNYYRSVCSKKTFKHLGKLLFLALWRWARRRHHNKPCHWVAKKYWGLGNPKWQFATATGKKLWPHVRTKIVRHIKVAGTRSPFDGNWTYWASRQSYYPGVTLWLAMVLKRQMGKCLHCGLLFMPNDLIETHHQLDAEGKRTGKMDALHRHCHDVVHRPKRDVEPSGSIHDKD